MKPFAIMRRANPLNFEALRLAEIWAYYRALRPCGSAALRSRVRGGSARGEYFRGLDEASLRGRPIDTRVGDRYAVFERCAIGERLVARADIALEHQAHYCAIAGGNLVDQCF